MSVLTQIGVEIDRIETAKASIKAAIEGKGVSVPSDTKIDGMSGYIDAIATSENLDTVLAQQETLIEDIKTALEGKAGGSGVEVETCTITVNDDSSAASSVLFSSVSSDGIIVWNNLSSPGNGTFSIVKNTVLIIQDSHLATESIVFEGEISEIQVNSGYAYVYLCSGDGTIYVRAGDDF